MKVLKARKIGGGLLAVTALAAGCFPDPGNETPGPTTTTTTEATTTTTEATTTTTTAAPVVWNPQITVSTTSGIDPDGDTITITGTGFDPDANTGSRPPLSGRKSGVYVTFGKFADVWQPSLGSGVAPSSTRQVISQIWAMPQASYDVLGGIPGTTVLGADGSFEVTLNAAPSATGTNAYGVAVYPGSGAVNPAQELLTRVTFAPKVTASKTADLVEGEIVTVSGVGFLPSTNGTRPPMSGVPSGVYVTFGRFADVWRPSLGSAAAPGSTRSIITQLWALPEPQFTGQGGQLPYIEIEADGSFTAQVQVLPSTNTNPNYGFAVYPASGAVNASQEFLLPTTWVTAG